MKLKNPLKTFPIFSLLCRRRKEKKIVTKLYTIWLLYFFCLKVCGKINWHSILIFHIFFEILRMYVASQQKLEHILMYTHWHWIFCVFGKNESKLHVGLVMYSNIESLSSFCPKLEYYFIITCNINKMKLFYFRNMFFLDNFFFFSFQLVDFLFAGEISLDFSVFSFGELQNENGK